MTGSDRTPYCQECARLHRARDTARLAGDRSRETDCVVLLRRHITAAHPPASRA